MKAHRVCSGAKMFLVVAIELKLGVHVCINKVHLMWQFSRLNRQKNYQNLLKFEESVQISFKNLLN